MALQVSKSNVGENLKEGGRNASAGTRSGRMTGVLLVGQIGLTIVLLVGAGLMMRSLLTTQQFDIGALDLPMRRGRAFAQADGAEGAEAIVVNEQFVMRYFPDEDPLGRRLRLGDDLNRGTEDPGAPWLTIVGVSPPVFQQSPLGDLSVQPTVYEPFRQEPPAAFTILARSSVSEETVTGQGIRRIGFGLSLGLLAAFGTSRILAAALVNMSATDPAAFITISILLAAVTLLACVVPARRATRLDPVDALRTE